MSYIPNKKSPRWYASRHQDIYTDLGFNYKGKIFQKSVSPVIMQNKVNKKLLEHIEPLIQRMIEMTKQIRLHYMFSLDKNDDRIR